MNFLSICHRPNLPDDHQKVTKRGGKQGRRLRSGGGRYLVFEEASCKFFQICLCDMCEQRQKESLFQKCEAEPRRAPKKKCETNREQKDSEQQQIYIYLFIYVFIYISTNQYFRAVFSYCDDVGRFEQLPVPVDSVCQCVALYLRCVAAFAVCCICIVF